MGHSYTPYYEGRRKRSEVWSKSSWDPSVQRGEFTDKYGLFGNDFAIDIVASFTDMFDSTTTEFVNAALGGAGSPATLATIVASIRLCHGTTGQSAL